MPRGPCCAGIGSSLKQSLHQHGVLVGCCNVESCLPCKTQKQNLIFQESSFSMSSSPAVRMSVMVNGQQLKELAFKLSLLWAKGCDRDFPEVPFYVNILINLLKLTLKIAKNPQQGALSRFFFLGKIKTCHTLLEANRKF